MAILAPFPVSVDPPEIPDTSQRETRTLAFRALDGSFPFPSTGTEFFFMPDITGIDLPPVEVVTQPVPGMEGERLREIRTLKREVFLPLWMKGFTHEQYLARRDQLARLFDYRLVDYRAEDGTFDLVASSIRGERSLRCTYVDGMTAGKWPTESAVWAKLGITVQACRPYWFGDRWETPVIRQEGAVSTFPDFPLQLSPGTALGADIPITVEGNVESWITLDLVGPATSVAVSSLGLSLDIPAGLDDGETAKIVTDPRGRTALFDGVKDWSRIGPTTTWQPLQPGDREISIVVAGSGPNSSAVVSGPSQFSRPW